MVHGAHKSGHDDGALLQGVILWKRYARPPHAGMIERRHDGADAPGGSQTAFRKAPPVS